MSKNKKLSAWGTYLATSSTGQRKSALRRFAGDEDGGLIMFSLYILITMLLITGLAVDMMRAETHRSRLQATLDRAVLAGASLEQTLNSKDVVLDYFDKAGLGAYIDADDVNVIETPTSKTVNATAEMTLNTYFLKMLGVTTLQAPAGGQAEESLSDIEISLVLDVSGSMYWNSASGNSKISELRDAANEFVYLMQCDPDAEKPYDNVCVVEPNTISISLIPYAEQVLVGEDLLQEFNITNEHTDSSCVDFEDSDFLTTSLSLTDSLQRAGTIDRRSYHSHSGGHDSWTRFARNTSRTCRTESYRQVVPFSNSYTTLQGQINNLQASGYTSIHYGMKWAAALLDPAFRPALTNLSAGVTPLIDPAFDGRPFDYSRPRTKKVVVLMTDGANTSIYDLKSDYYSGLSPFWLDGGLANKNDKWALSVYRESTGKYYRVDGNGNGGSWHSTPRGGSNAVQLTYQEVWQTYAVDYWDDEFWWLPDIWNYTTGGTMNSQLNDICTAAKAQGIEIFTLGFETSASSSAVMASCASSESHHFDVDGTDISQAFNSIAREIHELRLTN